MFKVSLCCVYMCALESTARQVIDWEEVAGEPPANAVLKSRCSDYASGTFEI